MDTAKKERCANLRIGNPRWNWKNRYYWIAFRNFSSLQSPKEAHHFLIHDTFSLISSNLSYIAIIIFTVCPKTFSFFRVLPQQKKNNIWGGNCKEVKSQQIQLWHFELQYWKSGKSRETKKKKKQKNHSFDGKNSWIKEAQN